MVGYRPPISFSQLWEIATRAPPLKGAARLPHSVKPPHTAFHPQPHALGSAAAPRSAKESVHGFLRSVADGVFAPLKVHSATAHLAPTSFRLAPKQARFAGYRPSVGGSSRLGARARPTVAPFPSHPAHVGLGAARQFSSAGQGAFHNVLANVPLALRALGGEGLDEAKWRRARRELRRELRTASKGKGPAVSNAERQEMREKEFSNFFTVAAAAVEQSEAQRAFASVSSPIVLVLPLEPALDLSAAAYNDSTRLLPLEVLHSLDEIQQAYTAHAKRVRALNERLTRAGVFDDPHTRAELQFVSDGRKEVQISFGPRWTREDVLQAAGAWGGGRSEWWFIQSSSSNSTSSSALEDEELERMEHDQTSQTLVLPTSTDLDFSSYTSSSASEQSEMGSTLAHLDALRSLAPSLTPSERSSAEVWADSDWDDSLTHELSPPLSPQATESHWSITFEDEPSDEEAEESSSRWSASAHESDLRLFLRELEGYEAREGPVGGQRMFARM